MKKTAVFLAVMMCLCVLAAPVSALTANGSFGEVPLYKGAISVDGKLDEAYTRLGLKIDCSHDYDEKRATDTQADIYMLHDGGYLYVAIDVRSGYPLGEYNPAYDGTKSWNTTCAEISFDWSNDAAGTDIYKYMCRFDGQIFGGYQAADKVAEQVEYAAAADMKANTFILEMKLKMQEGAAAGKEIGVNCMIDSDKTMGKDKTATRTICATTPGKSVNDGKLFQNVTLSAKEVKLPEVTTAATQKASASAGSSAATFDAAVILAAAVSAAGAGVVITKKKH